MDRTDGRVAGLFEPLHPAILRVVRQVIRVGARRRRGVAVCGEMAGDPGALLLLLGLGVTEFSMTPAPFRRRGAWSGRSAWRICAGRAARALRLGTADEIRAMLKQEFPRWWRGQAAAAGPGAQRRRCEC